jgi:serine phosphatase RsbU (regulator of sigma subunit)
MDRLSSTEGRPSRRTDDSATARLRLLYELGCAFAEHVDLDELSRTVVAECRDVLDAEAASILLLEPDGRELYFPYTADDDPQVAARLRNLRFPADRGIAGAVLADGRPLRVDDAANDPRFYTGVDRLTGLVTRNILCAPLRSHQGTIGVVQVLNRRDGGCFSDDDLSFLDTLAASVAVAIENARLYAQLREQVAMLERAVLEHNELLAIRRELDIAASIQQSILPRTFPPFPARKEFEIFAEMTPAREVGGDFYDFFFIDETHLGLVIGDVSGKGMPAALFMAVSRTLLKSIAVGGTPPAPCLERVNRLLCAENSAEMFVSIFFGVLNTRTGEIEYSNCGHNPPYVLRRSGRLEVLAGTGGTVLGILDDARCNAKRTVLGPGDALFLYTDGVTEAMDDDGQLFSDARLATVLARTLSSPETLVRAVVDSVTQHSGTAPQSDDVTILALRYAG